MEPGSVGGMEGVTTAVSSPGEQVASGLGPVSAPTQNVQARDDVVDAAGGAPRQLPPPSDPVGIVFADAGAACSLPETQAADAVLFSGALRGEVCRTASDLPYGTFWFGYQDAELGLAHRVGLPGCHAESCSLHVQGPTTSLVGYSTYGAGVGFPMAANNGPIDVSRFAGIQYWARGTIVGTRGPGYSNSPQMLLLKLVTATERQGDDFGMYCRIDPVDWTLCRQELSDLRRDGYVATPDPTTDRFDAQNLVKVQFEFPLYLDPVGAVPTPVSFDVELAAISYF